MTTLRVVPAAFEDHPVHRIEYGPKRVPCVLLPEQAAAMGYADPKDLAHLVADLKRSGDLEEGEDFITLGYEEVKELREAFAVGLEPTANPISPMTRELTALTRSGVVVVCMRSNLPKARAFRKWAKRVLVEVIETGSYRSGPRPPSLHELRLTWADCYKRGDIKAGDALRRKVVADLCGVELPPDESEPQGVQEPLGFKRNG
jgi:prophage antirepressor-like protein